MMMIYEKLANIQKELFVPKGQKNDFGGYPYRSCEDILKKVKPLCEKNKCVLTMTNVVEAVGDRNYVNALVTLVDLESDEKITSGAQAREALERKGQDASQITGAASSYARKYALAGLFCIDNEKDADTNEYTRATPEQIKKLKELTGEKEQEMLDYYKVKKIEDLTLEQADRALKAFAKKKGE
jgi:hypothetical protein